MKPGRGAALRNIFYVLRDGVTWLGDYSYERARHRLFKGNGLAHDPAGQRKGYEASSTGTPNSPHLREVDFGTAVIQVELDDDLHRSAEVTAAELDLTLEEFVTRAIRTAVAFEKAEKRFK